MYQDLQQDVKHNNHTKSTTQANINTSHELYRKMFAKMFSNLRHEGCFVCEPFKMHLDRYQIARKDYKRKGVSADLQKMSSGYLFETDYKCFITISKLLCYPDCIHRNICDHRKNYRTGFIK